MKVETDQDRGRTRPRAGRGDHACHCKRDESGEQASYEASESSIPIDVIDGRRAEGLLAMLSTDSLNL